MDESLALRRKVAANTRRVVIKVGSRLLVDIDGSSKKERIEQLIAEIAAIRERGIEVILVSSGAIAAGMKLSGEARRPGELPQLQALAAIGQGRLIGHYQAACHKHGFLCGQILLSADDVQDRQRHLNVRHCLNALLERGVLPIINENDAVSVEEIKFGDNDRLAALVGTLCWANLTVLLTSVDGLRRREGQTLGDRIPLVTDLDEGIRAMAGDTDDVAFSTGGMRSKLVAAEIVTNAGENLWIADGRNFGVLRRIMAGEDLGTLFASRTPPLTGYKRFLAFFSAVSGSVVVDDGAVEALVARKRSLLPVGIVEVKGEFGRGDAIEVLDRAGDRVGVGYSNFAADELARIKGKSSTEVAGLLGSLAYQEAINRDNLVIVR